MTYDTCQHIKTFHPEVWRLQKEIENLRSIISLYLLRLLRTTHYVSLRLLHSPATNWSTLLYLTRLNSKLIHRTVDLIIGVQHGIVNLLLSPSVLLRVYWPLNCFRNLFCKVSLETKLPRRFKTITSFIIFEGEVSCAMCCVSKEKVPIRGVITIYSFDF